MGLMMAGFRPQSFMRTPIRMATRISDDFPLAPGEAVQIEVDISGDGEEPDLTWADADVLIIDVDAGQFEVTVTEWASLPSDDEDYEEAYVDGPYLASAEAEYVDGFSGRWRRKPKAGDEAEPPTTANVAAPAPDASIVAGEFPVRFGESVLIEVDVADDDDATELVWAAASVSSIDASAGTFEVDVTEWANLPPDDDDYEPAYTDGPFVASAEAEYVDGFSGRWRRELKPGDQAEPPTTAKAAVTTDAAASPFPVAMGEGVLIEVDVADDDDATELVWAAASVSSIDASAGTFEVDVTEWASLPPDDDDYEPAYTDGPFVAASEGSYVQGYDGRWTRGQRIAAEWTVVDGTLGAWWSQDERMVSLVVPLAAGASAKRDVSCTLSDTSLSLAVDAAGMLRKSALSLKGRLSHGVDGDESEWYIEDSVDGFESFPPGVRFLSVRLTKATRGVTWAALVLADGARPDAKVTIKRTDGVTIRRPDRKKIEERVAKPETAKTLFDALLGDAQSSGPPTSTRPSVSKTTEKDGVKVTIRRKAK